MLLDAFFTTTSVGQRSGRCIAQLVEMSIDSIFIELTADAFRSFF